MKGQERVAAYKDLIKKRQEARAVKDKESEDVQLIRSRKENPLTGIYRQNDIGIKIGTVTSTSW